MGTDWFGRQARSENALLGQRSESISILLQNSHLLEAGEEHLRQLADRCNHKLPSEALLSAVTEDIKLLMDEDRQSGAHQINPECRPLVLLVEFGYESILLAIARLNHLHGRNLCEIKFHQLLNGGTNKLEHAINDWLCELAASQHPQVLLFRNPAAATPHFEALTRKIIKLVCNDAPDNSLIETVVVNDTLLSCSIPFSCKTISEKFMSLLGEFGKLPGLIRSFLKNTGIDIEQIDRIICAGITGRLPLLRNTLRAVTSKPVIATADWYRASLSPNVVIGEPIMTRAVIKIQVNQDSLYDQYRSERKQRENNDNDERLERLLQTEREKAFKQNPELLQYAESHVHQETKPRAVQHHKKQKQKQADTSFFDAVRQAWKDCDQLCLLYTDPQTGLQWVRNGNLANRKMNWHDAQEWVEQLDYAGYQDWRLPTKEELEKFAKIGGKHPPEWFNANGFNNVQADLYWSSTTPVSDSSRAWYVDLSCGSVDYDHKGYLYFVWPVRAGQ